MADNMSVLTLMATALDHKLRARGLRLPLGDCAQILRDVIDEAAAAARDLPSSPPAHATGPALDGGCIVPQGDASAVDFSSSET